MDFASQSRAKADRKTKEGLNRNSKSCIKPAVVPLTSRVDPLIPLRAHLRAQI